jgi:hypothetical protein
VDTYESRPELDVLEQFDGFFEASFGDWLARLPVPELMADLVGVELANMIELVSHHGRARAVANPSDKIERFINYQCVLIQAFRDDIDVINMINALEQHDFPGRSSPPQARELPEKVLRLKQYDIFCMDWKRGLHDLFMELLKERYERMLRNHVAARAPLRTSPPTSQPSAPRLTTASISRLPRAEIARVATACSLVAPRTGRQFQLLNRRCLFWPSVRIESFRLHVLAVLSHSGRPEAGAAGAAGFEATKWPATRKLRTGRPVGRPSDCSEPG